MLRKVALDQIPSLLSTEAEKHVDALNVAREQTDRVRGLRSHILIYALLPL
jgi:hypothetical protein